MQANGTALCNVRMSALQQFFVLFISGISMSFGFPKNNNRAFILLQENGRVWQQLCSFHPEESGRRVSAADEHTPDTC